MQEREAGQTLEVVARQVRGALAGLAAPRCPRRHASPTSRCGPSAPARPPRTAQAQEVHAAIRELLRELAGDAAEQVRIQYGGSVKPDNAAELLAQPDVDGALVGGASLKAQDFSNIVKGALR